MVSVSALEGARGDMSKSLTTSHMLGKGSTVFWDSWGVL